MDGVAYDEVRGFPSLFRTTSSDSPWTARTAGERTGSSMGPRIRWHALAPPSAAVANAGEGVDADADADGTAEVEGSGDADAEAGAGADPDPAASTGPVLGGAPLHAGRTTKTS